MEIKKTLEIEYSDTLRLKPEECSLYTSITVSKDCIEAYFSNTSGRLTIYFDNLQELLEFQNYFNNLIDTVKNNIE